MSDMKLIMEIFGRFKKEVETPEVFGSEHPDWEEFMKTAVAARDTIINKGLKMGKLDPYRAELVRALIDLAVYMDTKDLNQELKTIINMVRRLIKHKQGEEISQPGRLNRIPMGRQLDKARDFASKLYGDDKDDDSSYPRLNEE